MILSEKAKNNIPGGYQDKNEISNFGPSIVAPVRALVSLLEDALYRTFLCEMISTVIVFIVIVVLMALSIGIGIGLAVIIMLTLVFTKELEKNPGFGGIPPVLTIVIIVIGSTISSILALIFGLIVADVPRRLSMHVEDRLKGIKADFEGERNCGKCSSFVFKLFFTTWLEGLIIGVLWTLISLILWIIPVIGWIVYFILLIVVPITLVFWIGYIQFKIVFIARGKYMECLKWCWKHKGATLGFGLGTLLLFCIPVINLFAFFSNVIASTRVWMYVEYYQNCEIEDNKELKEEKDEKDEIQQPVPIQQTVPVQETTLPLQETTVPQETTLPVQLESENKLD